MDKDNVWAILVAAGSGERLKAVCQGSKQFYEWQGRPLYWHSALALSRCPALRGIVFVFPQAFVERESGRLARLAHELGCAWKVAAGGASRQESVRNGLAAVPQDCTITLVHDAARPFIAPALTGRMVAAILAGAEAAAPAIPVKDTIKMRSPKNPDLVGETLPRDELVAVQTPQAFRTALLRKAHAHAKDNNFSATDDCALAENLGQPVQLVAGELENIKITTPEDLKLLSEKECYQPVVGFGYDVHRYGNQRPLKIGGVLMPGNLGVIAHSDGDVCLHALMDAIAGCAGLGDIGRHFPDSDPALDGISSAILLNELLARAREAGIKLCNADVTIIAQKPKLAPYAEEIRKNIARLLNLPAKRVNFKATTEEGLGFTGSMEGIKACAIVSALTLDK